MSVIAIEERDVRGRMTGFESRLELIRFTVDEDRQEAGTRAVAEGLPRWLDRRENGPSWVPHDPRNACDTPHADAAR